ncbi:transcription cofactor vestigial-like protein 2 [Amblyraja radiata]|uniref:transcription cofactor vestigial-like protein 2 n=1 Tax=Amblyraja radiata TaxID=386614 RepID=UPI001401E7A5|nr:transcription cofactor vestigial-like protein 2 [Amblyraja radiata]
MSGHRPAPPRGSSSLEAKSGARVHMAPQGAPPTSPDPPSTDPERSTRCTILTYFTGDINSMVDEHFSRALNRAKTPAIAGAKRKADSIESRAGEEMPAPWPPAGLWPHPYLGPPPPAARTAGPTPSDYQPGLRAGTWLLPGGQHVYPAPADPERRYSPLLVRIPGQNRAPPPRPKVTGPATWTATPPGLPSAPGAAAAPRPERWSSDEGLERQELQGDIYWY